MADICSFDVVGNLCSFLRNVKFKSCFEFDKMIDDIEINFNEKLNAI